MTKTVAYIRTSTNRQDLGLEFQLGEVRKYEPDRIYKEQISGRKEDRPELSKALKSLKAGDTLLVYKLDRLGRSVKQLVNIIAELDAMGAHFKSIHDQIDTSTTNGKFMFTILSAVAELEANMISERTKDALKATNKRLGRPKTVSELTKKKILTAYQSHDLTVQELAKRYHVSTTYVYKLAKKAGLSRSSNKMNVAHT
ncbi:recombinase family protein [Furfurilactobacillus curtus]|uniref:Recombinase family protein n=1 Tax=Furfurilactobacillus curtus TaxID=1746200 RepID=A0ABQ5JPC8_9LACO